MVDLDDRSTADDPATYQQYRSLSSVAVASVILAVFSLLGVWFPSLLAIAVVAIVAGLYALAELRRRSDELTGRGLALTGLALGAVILVGGVSLHAAIYVLEVPEGYERISYRQLQPERNSPYPIPLDVQQLHGKKVFIKGYVFPGSRLSGIREFLLVRDRGCCFGANPKLTDRVQITLREDAKGLDYDTMLHGVSGVFRVETSTDAIDVGGQVFYHIDEAEAF